MLTPAAPRVQSTEELDEKRARTASGIAACGWLYRSGLSRRQPPRRRPSTVTFPMSDSFIGDRRERHGRPADSGQRDRLGSGAFEVFHVQITRHSGAVRQCLDGKGSLPPRDFGDGGHRPRLTPTQGGRVMSAPHARGRMRRRRRAVFDRRCRRLGGGSAGCLHGPGRRRFRKPGPTLRGSMPTSRFRPG